MLGASSVTYQDFNQEVLDCVTVPCVQANMTKHGVQGSDMRLLAGDWAALEKQIDSGWADLILTSETIYNPANYESLHNLIFKALAPDGVCLLGAKRFYYGVGGSSEEFIEFVGKRGLM